MITDKARKVLALALDPNAADGEWQAAAKTFVFLLRKSGVTLEILEGKAQAPEPESCEIMTFGKFRGRHIYTVPIDYLRYAVANFQNLPPAMRNRMIFEVENRRL